MEGGFAVSRIVQNAPFKGEIEGPLGLEVWILGPGRLLGQQGDCRDEQKKKSL